MFRSAISRGSVLPRVTLRASVPSRFFRTAFLNSRSIASTSRALKEDLAAARAEAKERQKKLQLDWDAPKLTYEQVKPRTLQPSPDAYLIDVREPDEVIQGSIPSSVNLPLSGITSSFHLNEPAFKEKHGFEKPRKDQEIVFYCRSGKRSATACDVAKRNGFTNVYNYEGSWLDWSAREGPK